MSLTNDLLHDIADPTNRKLTVVKLAAHLNRLGAGVAARDAFLVTRTEVLRKRSRMIRFEGSISLYVSELALVTFTHVKHTAEWYLASWREHDMASGEFSSYLYVPPDGMLTWRVRKTISIVWLLSGMVTWAKERIEVFATMFRRQVYGPDVDAQTIQESVQVTRLQGKRVRFHHNTYRYHTPLTNRTALSFSAPARYWAGLHVPARHASRSSGRGTTVRGTVINGSRPAQRSHPFQHQRPRNSTLATPGYRADQDARAVGPELAFAISIGAKYVRIPVEACAEWRESAWPSATAVEAEADEWESGSETD